jgi:hypothetical protein
MELQIAYPSQLLDVKTSKKASEYFLRQYTDGEMILSRRDWRIGEPILGRPNWERGEIHWQITQKENLAIIRQKTWIDAPLSA